MLYGLDIKELEAVIKGVMDKLESTGLIPPGLDKASIISTVTEKLAKDPEISLTKETLNDVAVQKALGVACIAQANPSNKFDYSLLFKDKLLLDKTSTDTLKLLFKDMFKKDPNQLEKIDTLMNVLSKNLTPENQKELGKDLLAMQILQEGPMQQMQRDQRVQDYGVDTHNPGSVLKVVQAVVAGNQMGRQDLARDGDSLMGKMGNPDANTPDPLGTIASAVINSIADGVITSDSERDMLHLVQEKGMPTYKSPTLAPPGSHG